MADTPLWRRRLLWLAPLALALASPATAGVLVKLATFVPADSIWDRALKQMGADWRQASNGEVTLRIYPGGVAGDDADVVRKMRIGQLQAGALTIAGLAEIDDAFDALAVPLLFDSYDELFHVLDLLEPEFRARLESKGFVLLNWGHAGWAHLFSKRPIRTVDDLRRLKIYTWAGDQEMVEWWKDNGFQPVPLAMTDILTGLQTGMIDAIFTPPLAALSLQWFRQTPYMHDLGVAPVLGATVIKSSVWERVPPPARGGLLDAARRVEDLLKKEIPRQDEAAVEAMKERGLEVTSSADRAEWSEVAQRFVRTMRASMPSSELFDRVVAERDTYRRGRAAGESP